MSAVYYTAYDYTGNEAPVSSQSIRRLDSDGYFQVSKVPLPPSAVMIVENDTVIGFQRDIQGNTWTYDLDGRTVLITEPGLGKPFIARSSLLKPQQPTWPNVDVTFQSTSSSLQFDTASATPIRKGWQVRSVTRFRHGRPVSVWVTLRSNIH